MGGEAEIERGVTPIRRCHASTRESSASVTAPASGPNSRTDANAKTSETVNVASTPGTFSVMRPLMNVRAANIHHSTGTPTVTTRVTHQPNSATPSADTALT